MSRSLRLVLIILFPILAGVGTFLYLQREFYKPANANDTTVRLIEIEPDRGFAEICAKLQAASVVRSCWSLGVLARIREIDTIIKAGEYELTPAMTPRQILEKMAKGDVFKRIVVVREGETIWNLGELVEKAGLVPRAEFNRTLVDKKLLAQAGILAETFEGYLFPDTYQFSRPIKPQQIIWRMLERGEVGWKEEYTKRADELHLTRHEILTLASIIEKESGNVEEQPVVSSVFHNRLDQGMRLQSDPTVIYGIPDFNGNLTRENLQTPSPYNTYVNFGLPPGPIANPGESAIKAALYPAQTPFIFFVANGQGGHVFATTLQEHNENVRKYQKAPAAAAAAAAAQAAANAAKPPSVGNSAESIANQIFPR